VRPPAAWSTSGSTRRAASCGRTSSPPAGKILEYTYRVDGDLLTIWFGGTESPARFDGRFGSDGRVNEGAWQWPGGGYASTMTRLG